MNICVQTRCPLCRNVYNNSSSFHCHCYFLLFYYLSLICVFPSQGGIYWFTLIDSFSTSFGLIIITLFMCIGISFFYGTLFYCLFWCVSQFFILQIWAGKQKGSNRLKGEWQHYCSHYSRFRGNPCFHGMTKRFTCI